MRPALAVQTRSFVTEPAKAGPARLQRALVVGPVARLELQAQSDDAGPLIEAQISSEQFTQLGLRAGERLRLTPRRAGVFLAA
jgi:sulfate transport system ATP-binding protein